MTMPDLTKHDWKVSERAHKLHADALVWDDHAGFEPHPTVDLEILEHWRAAGVDYLSVNVGYDVAPWQKTIKNIGAFITWLEKNSDRFTLVKRSEFFSSQVMKAPMFLIVFCQGATS